MSTNVYQVSKAVASQVFFNYPTFFSSMATILTEYNISRLLDQIMATSPFCEANFNMLGCHLAECPKREGRDYLMYLSQKTLDKKEGKGKKQCPKCKKNC